MNHVGFTLLAPFTSLFSAYFAVVSDVIIEANHLSANKAAFKVGVNNAGGFGCVSSFTDCPGASFFRAGCEVSFKIQLNPSWTWVQGFAF